MKTDIHAIALFAEITKALNSIVDEFMEVNDETDSIKNTWRRFFNPKLFQPVRLDNCLRTNKLLPFVPIHSIYIPLSIPVQTRSIAMSRYRISVEVKIEESEEAIDTNPVEQADGSFRLVVSDETASSIDECEQALLRTKYAAVRQAIALHLSAVSKKKPASMPPPGAK